MALTLLQIVDRASSELGIAAPATVISNTNLYVTQMLNLVNGLGLDLVAEHEWQKLTVEYRFTTVYYTYTATTASGSTTISVLSSTTGITTNPTYFAVTGAGIPQDTYLVSVNAGASTAVLSRAATATGTLVDITFAQVRYAFPADFDRLIDDTEWDKTRNEPTFGPETAQQWQYLKSGWLSTSPLVRFRQLGDLFQIWAPLAAEDYMGFEYVSNYWVAATAAALSKTSFTVDSDTCAFPDALMIQALKLRFRMATGKNLDLYTKAELDSGLPSRVLNTAKSADAGSPKLSMAGRSPNLLLGYPNIPEGNFDS